MLAKIKQWYLTDKKIIFASLVVGFSVALIFALASAIRYSDSIQGGIASEVIRFHVLANSDSAEDQALKLMVRDEIIDTMAVYLSDANSVSDARTILSQNIDLIESCAKDVLEENGSDYAVHAYLQNDVSFPTKTYGDIAFPSGKYEALRVVIGEGEGQNWWCVMFPPLCFVDVTNGTVAGETKEELKQALTDEEYNLVVNSGKDGEIPVKIKFKTVEIWQDMKSGLE